MSIINKPEIVFLDTLPLNPGDLSWDALEQLGNLTLYNNTAPEQVSERIRRAEIVLTNKVPVQKPTLKRLRT